MRLRDHSLTAPEEVSGGSPAQPTQTGRLLRLYHIRQGIGVIGLPFAHIMENGAFQKLDTTGLVS